MSRLERDELSPTFETFERLLAVLGETFEIEIRREAPDVDRDHLADLLGRPRRVRLVTRLEVPLDAGRIFEALAAHAVDYTLIGGLAVQAHGHTRTTQDVDIVPAPDPDNLARLAAALEGLGARRAGRPKSVAGRPLSLDSRSVTSLDTDAGGVDVHLSPAGAAPYADLRRRALVIEVRGVRIPVASRDDLIAMKRTSGGPIDRGDVRVLTEPRPPR